MVTVKFLIAMRLKGKLCDHCFQHGPEKFRVSPVVYDTKEKAVGDAIACTESRLDGSRVVVLSWCPMWGVQMVWTNNTEVDTSTYAFLTGLDMNAIADDVMARVVSCQDDALIAAPNGE